MKRVLILLISLLVSVPLALGSIAGVAYYSTSAENIPQPTITAMDMAVAPCGYQWREPVFGGLIHRDFTMPLPDSGQQLGKLGDNRFPLEIPAGYSGKATITYRTEVIWSGRTAELEGYQFKNNGRYDMLVECERMGNSVRGSGVIQYLLSFTVSVEPRYEISGDGVSQGDVAAIRVYNLVEGYIPEAESNLGKIVFTPTEEGVMTAYVPIGHNRESGAYTITLKVAHFSWQIQLRVIESSYSIETYRTTQVIEGIEIELEERPENNPALTRDYYNYIQPLYDETVAEQYWEGVFIPPVSGVITRDYGTLRYTDNEREPTSWAGVDYEADKGDPVVAPAAGKIVFAEQLDSTGNTIVIEHGGGLKSLLFHMDKLHVEVGEMVEQGQEIGTVGSTGWVKGPKLHYEARLWYESVNPNHLFDGTSNLYYFDE